MEFAKMGARNLAFLLTELPGAMSRQNAVIKAGAGIVAAGTVLGMVTDGGEFVPSPAAEVAGLEGAEDALAVLAYSVDATDAAAETVVIFNQADVKLPMLSFDASVNDAAKTDAKLAQLGTVNIRAL